MLFSQNRRTVDSVRRLVYSVVSPAADSAAVLLRRERRLRLERRSGSAFSTRWR